MKTKGYTLVEILVVLTIIGMLVLTALPNVLKTKTSGEIESAKLARGMIHQAMSGYLGSLSRRDAETTWTAMTEEQRYNALKRFLSYPPTTIAGITPQGYTITLGADIHALPELRDAAGTLIP